MKPNLLFCYGILKKGFTLDLEKYGAEFVDKAMVPGAILYRIGSGVGLRFTEDKDREAFGEVFKIPDNLWNWLDGIEANGFCYTRKVVSVATGNPEGPDYGWVDAWVYEHTYPGFEYTNPILNGIYKKEVDSLSNKKRIAHLKGEKIR